MQVYQSSSKSTSPLQVALPAAIGALVITGIVLTILGGLKVLPMKYFLSIGGGCVLVGFSIPCLAASCAKASRAEGVQRVEGEDLKIVPTEASLQNAVGKDECIYFYKNGPTAFLGNFFSCPISAFHQHFQCAEAAFQWRKYDLTADYFLQYGTPQEKQLAQQLRQDSEMQQLFFSDGEQSFQLSRSLRAKYSIFHPDWNQNLRNQAMFAVLSAKFDGNPDLTALLSATGNAYLLEHNDRKGKDNYWSDDSDGTGANTLGRMLMAKRARQPWLRSNWVNGDPEEVKKHALNFQNRTGHYTIF